jgi:hypothetical protein
LRYFITFLMTLPCRGLGIQAGLNVGVPLTEYFETGANGGLHGSAVYSNSWDFPVMAKYHFPRSPRFFVARS